MPRKSGDDGFWGLAKYNEIWGLGFKEAQLRNQMGNHVIIRTLYSTSENDTDAP